ncbi:MAG: Na/Pi cotransporter family protein [Methylovirgula sp.]
MVNLNVFASILAGLGLFYIGIKGLAANLSQLAGRGLRVWVALSTSTYVTRALVGTVAGALTQSTSAVTVILMSLTTADLVAPRRAKAILVWANVGTAALVLLVAIDIHLFVLMLTAAAGICYYANLDRSPRWRQLVSAIFLISVMFLGLELMRIGTEALHDIPWLRESLHSIEQWNVAAFIVGIVFAIALQSSATVAVIMIAMAAAGLLTLEQSMLTIFGASAGSGLSTYMIARGALGTSRQLPILQAFVKILGIAVLLPLFGIEQIFHVPLLMHAIRASTDDPGRMVAYIYLACQLAAVMAEIIFSPLLDRLLLRVAPPSHEETASKPRYLYHQALNEPESALALVDREQDRVFDYLALHFGAADHLEDGEAIPKPDAVLHAATSLDRAIGHFLNDLADSNPSRELLEKIANRQARASLLQSIHESLAELVTLLATPFETEAMQSLGTNVSEGLAGLLLVASEAVRSGNADDLALLRQLTADRDSLVEQLRRRVIAADRSLAARDQQTLYAITSIFERVVWMLRRYAALLNDQAQPALSSQLETSPAILS